MDNKIIIVSWYKSNNVHKNPNCIDIVKQIFINKHYDVECFPFMQIRNNNKNYIEIFDKFIKDFDAKYILFWNWSCISEDELKLVKNNNYEKVFIIFNWDDPHCWLKEKNMFKYFDISYSTCYGTLQNYKSLGVKISKYLLPGYSQLTHYYDKDNSYKCDVAFLCTNLYKKNQNGTDSRILVDRESLVKMLDQDPNINFHLYGPPSIKHAAPSSYRGFIPYEKNRLVFSNAKININVHGANGDGYLNERAITILGSGGLMLIDQVDGLERNLEDGVNCCVIKDNKTEKIVGQIREILGNYDNYYDIRNNGHKLVLDNYTYDQWTDNIIDGINEYEEKYEEHKNLDKIEVVFGVYLDNNYIKLEKIIELRENINAINGCNKVSWNLNSSFINLQYTYVSSMISLINHYVNKYGDSISLGFGFLNHVLSLEQMIDSIKEFEKKYTEILLLENKKRKSNKLFGNIPKNMRPKSVMSYSISQHQIKWIKENLNIKYFMSWTATQTNTDGFSGAGTILSPYYTHKDNPMVVAKNDDESSGCILLNTLSVDPIGCRHTTGESRWTIHPADPMTDGESQIMLFRRYLSNKFIGKNHFNYMSIFFDTNWIYNTEHLYKSWNNILNFLKKISIKINTIDNVCDKYTSMYKNNDGIDFKLYMNGLGFEKCERKSEIDKTYLWYENKNNRIIFEKNNDKYDVIDFTNYNKEVKPLEQINETNYITGKNYKLSRDAELTEEETKIAKNILDDLLQ